MIIDFSDCPYSNRHGQYGGQAGDKDGIVYNGENWIIKYPKSTAGMKGDNLPKYTTAPLSEYIGSHVYEILGFDVHETLLGERNNQIVVACKDFRAIYENLFEVRNLKNAANQQIQNYLGEEVPLSATGDTVILEELLLHFKVNPLMQSVEMIQRFWECAVVDILIYNNDRNNGNWGILSREDTGKRKLAPVYDNGNSFYNKLSEEQIAVKLQMPFEKLKSECIGIRTSYNYNDQLLSAKKFLNLDIPELQVAIIKIVPLIKEKLPEIMAFIEKIPESYHGKTVCSPERREFYEKGLTYRTEYLLYPAYEKAKEQMQSRENTQPQSNEKMSPSELMYAFIEERLQNSNLCGNADITVSDDGQCYIRNGQHNIKLDFQHGNIQLTDNTTSVSFPEMKKRDEEFWSVAKNVEKSLKRYLKSKGNKTFKAYFDGKQKD